ncbi:hypothetical protein OROMI_028418 [Orobanche minor]
METNKINQFFESVTNFFGGGDHVPWSTPDVILGCEREVAEARKEESADRTNESIMRLSWALVHSRKPEDVQRGIAMLEAKYISDLDPLDVVINKCFAYQHQQSIANEREILFASRRILQKWGLCKEQAASRPVLGGRIAPDMRQALSLKKTVEDRITKDGVIGIGITATAVGLIAGGIAAALARKK